MLIADKNGEIVARNDITLVKLAENWKNYNDANWSSNTRAWHGSNLKIHILSALGKCKVQDIRAQHIKRFFNETLAQKNLSATSINHIYRTLDQLLGYAVKKKIVRTNVLKDSEIKKPRENKRGLQNLPSQREILAFLEEENIALRMKAAIALAAFMGLRRGEVLGLTWSKVDLKRGLLTIDCQHTRGDGKNAVSSVKTESGNRTVVIYSYVQDILRALKDEQMIKREFFGITGDFSRSFVIANTTEYNFGSSLLASYFSRIYADSVKGSRLEWVTFHDLRHACASNLIHANIPLTTVAKTMGHSSPDVTMRIYAHAIDEQMLAEMAKVDAALSANCTELKKSIEEKDK